MTAPQYLSNIKFVKDISDSNGNIVHCYYLTNSFDEKTLQEWAHRIRCEYVSDKTIERLTSDGIDVDDFLNNRIPKSDNNRGCVIISGDFSELLMTDFREFILKESAFRGKLQSKPTPNSPIQGCDILTYRIDGTDASKDQLIITEAKSLISSTNYEVILKAASDSEKDSTRIGETLAFLLDFFSNRGNEDDYKKILRFTKKGESTFVEEFEASGLTVCCCLEESNITNVLKQIKTTQKNIYFVYGKDLKNLAYDLYRRALNDK